MGSGFWRVWFGESVSGIGDAAFAVAFSWLVLSATGSAGVLAGTLIAGAVPRGLLVLWLLGTPGTRALGVSPPRP